MNRSMRFLGSYFAKSWRRKNIHAEKAFPEQKAKHRGKTRGREKEVEMCKEAGRRLSL